MEPKDCPECVWTSIGPEHGVDAQGHYVVHCAKFKRALGWTHAHRSGFCEKCIAEGWYKRKALDVPELRVRIKRLLAGRFRNGDCPKWKGTGEHELDTDLSDWLRRYEGLSTREELERLFAEAVVQWASLDEKDGGHPMEVVVQKAEALAAEFGLEDVLLALSEEANPEA